MTLVLITQIKPFPYIFPSIPHLSTLTQQQYQTRVKLNTRTQNRTQTHKHAYICIYG